MPVSLSLQDSLTFLQKWEPASDVYAFQYCNTVLGVSACLSAAYINHRFRRALKLRNFAWFSTYGAAIFIPSVASALLHGTLVVKPMLMRQVGCPVCLEVRSGLTQAMCGVVYPMILSPLACIPFADRYMTMAVPTLSQQPLLVLKQVVQILRPISKKLLIIVAVQIAVGAAMAHCELSNILTVVEKVNAMEEAVKAKVPEDKMQSIREAASHDDFKELVQPDRPKRKYYFHID